MSGVILGEKSNQSQVFTEKGIRMPVTYIKTSPCYLVGIKSKQKDGYDAIKIGFKTSKKINKSTFGEVNKAGIKTPLRFFREIRIGKYLKNLNIINENNKDGIQIGEKKIFIGDEIKAQDIFKKDEKVNIIGKSKAKGFQGVVTRYKFAGGPKTHGQSDRLRAPGSIGQSTTPGRVYKGKRMAGRMGNEKITIKNLSIFNFNDGGLFVLGLVPGSKGNLLEIVSNN
jgi:large subunit ribosomal protein L3